MKITLQFPERLCCFVADETLNHVDDETFYLSADLRTKLKTGNYQPEDLVTVEITANAICKIIKSLGEESSHYAAEINAELKSVLKPQLVRYMDSTLPNFEDISTSNPELFAAVQEVIAFLNERENERQAWVNGRIESGRQRITA